MKRARPPIPQQRARELARIHQAKKQLGLDEDTYRAVLERVTGQRSAASLSAAGRAAVLAEFTRLGFVAPRHAFAGRPKNTDTVPMLGKVEALLADAKRPWAYAHAVARRMFGVARVEWLRHDDLHRLVAALEVDARRRAKRERLHG